MPAELLTSRFSNGLRTEGALEDPGVWLQGRFDEIVAARNRPCPHAAGPNHARTAQVTREGAQCNPRGVGSGIRTELLLTDEGNHLFGILDVAAGGTEGLIVNPKTGRDASAESSPAIKHQMTFYAHLFQVAFGVPPKHVIVFNLRQGPQRSR